jgi:hypothetical protein
MWHDILLRFKQYTNLLKKTNMKNNNILIALFLFITASFCSCAAIGDIFKTGVWVGVIGVIAVIGLIIFLVTRGKS